MACPFFLPTGALRETGWSVPPRAPLGALCEGECHAGPHPAPADHELCNFGYARGVCSRFPQDAPVDAARFSGESYVLERDHRPIEHGRIADLKSHPLAAQAAIFRLHTALAGL